MNKKYHILGNYAINGCDNDNPDEKSGSDFLIYTGPNLPGSGINTSDDLTIALQKIDTIIEELKSALYNLTTTTTTTVP